MIQKRTEGGNVMGLKELIIYMIINLSRVYPGFFNPTIQHFKDRIDRNQRSHNYIYNTEDIIFAESVIASIKS